MMSELKLISRVRGALSEKCPELVRAYVHGGRAVVMGEGFLRQQQHVNMAPKVGKELATLGLREQQDQQFESISFLTVVVSGSS